jgi:glycopeptide antibiotics resistance protein
VEVVLDDLRIALWPVGVAGLLVLLVILWRAKRSPAYLVCVTVFSIYLLLALDKAFFPISMSGSYVDAMRQARFSSFVNLIPFNFNLSEMPTLVYLQIFQNVFLTMPFGFGVSFVAPVRARDFLWLIPATGFGIETIQLVIALMLRYPYRVIDVNDAMLNALGVLTGYGIFRVFAWLYVLTSQRLGIELERRSIELS